MVQPNNLANREISLEWKKQKNKTFRNAQNFDNQILQKVKKERERKRERERTKERDFQREKESERGKEKERMK